MWEYSSPNKYLWTYYYKPGMVPGTGGRGVAVN